MVIKRRKKTFQTKIASKFPINERFHNIKNKVNTKLSSAHDLIVLIGQSNSANSLFSKPYNNSNILIILIKKCMFYLIQF